MKFRITEKKGDVYWSLFAGFQDFETKSYLRAVAGDRLLCGYRLYNRSSKESIETQFKAEIRASILDEFNLVRFHFEPLDSILQHLGEIDVYAYIVVDDRTYIDCLVCTWDRAQVAELKYLWNKWLK